MSQKIVITGPESTGKSTLTALLAKEYNASFVKEYAREYLEKLAKPYELDDVLTMAKEQLKQEQNTIGNLVFLDTDLTVFYIWIKEKYQKEVDWINEQLQNLNDKIYFLCDTDIEWEEDALREHPNIEDRKRLFQAYKNLLEKLQVPYYVISGDLETRLKKCREIIG